MKQIHLIFKTEDIAKLFEDYLNKKIKRTDIQQTLQISKGHFFRLLKKYKCNHEAFSIEYKRKGVKKITENDEKIIYDEIVNECNLVNNKNIPIYKFNSTYVWRQV